MSTTTSATKRRNSYTINNKRRSTTCRTVCLANGSTSATRTNGYGLGINL
jgi:hypothetical protein